jgi:hypothetical protein
MAIVRLIYFQSRAVLQVASIVWILLGVIALAYDHESSGRANLLLRRSALAVALGLAGACIYAFVPITLDHYGITPQPGHVKFYGLFFAPFGFLAGLLAAVFGSQRRFLAPAADAKPDPFSWKGYLLGVIGLWILFFIYSHIFLNPGFLSYALVRSSVTAPVGALLFAIAPFLVQRADKHVAGLFSFVGFVFIVAGLLAEMLLRTAVFFQFDLL